MSSKDCHLIAASRRESVGIRIAEMEGMNRGLFLALLLFCAFPLCAAAKDFANVNDFAYQLQGYSSDLHELNNNSFDLLVIDYSKDGSESGELAPSEVSSIQTAGPCGGKIVVSYLSVGEAEDYRYYWNPSWVDNLGNPIPGVAPSWLGPTNPDWVGNYKVRYWDPNWQNIVFAYLDRIIDQGFDGVYMDIIDAFEYWGPTENGGNNEKRDSAKLMIDFVQAIEHHARVDRGKTNFLIIPQNGAGLIADWTYPDAPDPVAEAAAQEARYFPLINAIGAEDVFFYGNKAMNNKYNPQSDTLLLLDQFRDGGKKVLSIDYLTKKKKVKQYYTVARNRGYIPYATVRDLDRFIVNKAYPPDCAP